MTRKFSDLQYINPYNWWRNERQAKCQLCWYLSVCPPEVVDPAHLETIYRNCNEMIPLGELHVLIHHLSSVCVVALQKWLAPPIRELSTGIVIIIIAVCSSQIARVLIITAGWWRGGIWYLWSTQVQTAVQAHCCLVYWHMCQDVCLRSAVWTCRGMCQRWEGDSWCKKQSEYFNHMWQPLALLCSLLSRLF